MSAPSRTKTTTESIVIDGTAYEGGGGLIRYALAFSSILNRPVHIHSIRAGRPGVGGLRSEHTVAVSTMAQLTSAVVIGNHTASRELTFTPYACLDADVDVEADALSPRPVLQQQKLDVTLEGSAGIFLVAMLPYLLFSRLACKTHHISTTTTPDEFELTIRAGTLCVKAPSIFYLRQVFLPTMELIGIGSNHLSIVPDHEQGWHTDTNKLRGKMTARIKPLLTPLPASVLDRRGRVQTVRATAHAPPQLLDKFKETLETELADAIARDAGVDIAVDMFPSLIDHQYHLLLAAEATAPAAFLGYEEVYPQRDVFPSDLEGDTDKIIRYLVRACIRGLWEELRRGHAMDENLEDMLALYQSLAVGFSSVITPQGDGCSVPEFNIETPALRDINYKIDTGSMHRETSWWMVRQFTGIQLGMAQVGGSERVGCHGIGFGTEDEAGRITA
ncbi:RNA 3'-terminal phosphate cyclase/enolpyruvate transferase [Dichotomopilus funicola]|uniref:RNA 3'-terminal phosphate cyclase/enolpyruvate transferase n=1 Tax=Dichotomopilus funicola TaxID=1934379 RepID=A0AAN6ZR88_9PEZI|nr:RNA 3'-terminal phosphate cyclase/enolpyruvate transferase [Dichotomopilus funicola]